MSKRAVQVGVVVGGVASQVLTPGPVGAHETRAYHGDDYAQVAADHQSTRVVDNECDGNYVEGEFHTVDGYRFSWADGNGCDPGFSSGGTGGHPIAQYRVCEVGVGCSAWHKP